jgi:hypothetical protein
MHKTVGMTPALAAGLCTEMWEMADLVAMVDRYDAAQPRKKAGRKPKVADG